MEIASERLIFREFSRADLPALLIYRADPRYGEFCGPEEATPEHTRGLLDTFLGWAEEVPRSKYQLAVAERGSSERAIGSCGIRLQEPDKGVGEFGLELAPEFWGRGFATEAARRMLRFAFRDLGLREIRGISVTENARVARLVSRLGFTKLDTRPGPVWMRSRKLTQTEWRLTAEQWSLEGTG